MGSALSKNEECFVWCGMEDDSYPEPMLNDDGATASLTEDVALGTEVRLPYSLNRFFPPALAYLAECRCSISRPKEREPLLSNRNQKSYLCLSCF